MRYRYFANLCSLKSRDIKQKIKTVKTPNLDKHIPNTTTNK